MSRTVHKFVARSILKNVTRCNIKSKSKPTVCDFRDIVRAWHLSIIVCIASTSNGEVNRELKQPRQ